MSLQQRLRKDVGVTILEATERVVGRVGIGRLTMQAVAKEAGVAVGTLYNHFGDRQRLLGTLVVRHRQELAESLSAAMQRTRREPLPQRLRAFAAAAISLFDRRRDFVRAALDSELWRAYADALGETDPTPRVRVQLETTALALVRVGLRHKLLAPHPAERLAAYLSGMLRGVLLSRARSEHPLPSVEHEAAALVSLFMNGAGVRSRGDSQPGVANGK